MGVEEEMSGKPSPFCEVALARPIRQTFVYRLPARLREEAAPGTRVLVPFRRRKLVGCIDRLEGETEVEGVREVLDVLDDRPLVPRPLLELCRWVADYYVAPLGLVLRTALPPGSFGESSHRVRLAADGDGGADGAADGAERSPGRGADRAGGRGADAGAASGTLSDSERSVLERLERATGPLLATTLRTDTGVSAVWPVLRSLRDRGLVEVFEEDPDPDPGRRSRQVIRLTESLPTLLARETTFGRAYRQREAYEALESLGGQAPVSHMSDRLGFSRSVLRGMAERGVAEIAEEAVERDPFAGREPVEPEPSRRPTARQEAAIDALRQRAGRPRPGVALLHGVTGSGKTLVYLHLLRDLVDRQGKSAIVLVPEISLTPQTVRRFRRAFGDRVAVLHSALSAGERHDEWKALREGRKRVAVGARSAVFAPVSELGAVVVDEEHEGSYKQSDTPRYHARAVAAMRCRMENALCVLGSATPSLESWRLAREDRYGLLRLPERVTPQPLPEVEVVDLRAERQARRDAKPPGSRPGGAPAGGDAEAPAVPSSGPLVLSDAMRAALAETLDREEQALLLLNRRGYSTYVQCLECGKVWTCRRCNVSLTLHRRRNRIVCHHCGHQEPPPSACDECGAEGLTFSGLGTEQVERRIGETFPAARIARMDVDTTATKWAHFEILERVRRREVDVLLGTQMIAKGHDFPDVTLVGVIDADVGLNLPDFRASERTFQLVSQVAGRAGRGDRPGRVVVQTARPDHFALRTAVRHDYESFAERELADREGPGYPPHRRLANLVVSGRSEEKVAEETAELGDWIREAAAAREEELAGLDVLGPAPCAIDRIRERWRWHLLLKSDRAAPLGALLRGLADRRGQPSGGLRLEIDRDPESLL